MTDTSLGQVRKARLDKIYLEMQRKHHSVLSLDHRLSAPSDVLPKDRVTRWALAEGLDRAAEEFTQRLAAVALHNRLPPPSEPCLICGKSHCAHVLNQPFVRYVVLLKD